MTGESLTATERWDAAMAAAVPHGPDEPCTCPECWACAGRVVGCTCDLDWCAAAELRTDGRPAEGEHYPEHCPHPYLRCDRCNYDTHTCQGCGEPVPHALDRTCQACRREHGLADPLAAAEGELRLATEALGMVEHCADDAPEQRRYAAALANRNRLRP